MIDLSPSIPDVIEYQLPENLRAQENILFVKFLKYYYEWMTQNGHPTDFINEILSYGDIDLTSSDFKKYLTNILIKFIPTSAQADQNLLLKHLTQFLKSKGNYESFQFIMRAVYREEIEMEWNSEKVFRPSANKFSREGSVAVRSNDAWTDMEGSILIQHSPAPASAVIKSYTQTTVNGQIVNWIDIEDSTLVGSFIEEGLVKALHNTIDRNKSEIEHYYQPKAFSNNILFFNAVQEENRSYIGLIIKQLNSTFRGKIKSFLTRKQQTSGVSVSVLLEGVTGTITNDDLYVISSLQEGNIILKTDYEYGAVSRSVRDIHIVIPGTLYSPGDKIKFKDGSGANVAAYISEVVGAPVTSIDIKKKGYGYSVGDPLSITEEFNGSGFTGKVESIDGIGGEIKIVSELNSASIKSGGYGFKVNDELEVVGGNAVAGTPPAKIKVLSVDSNWEFQGVRVVYGGHAYPYYTKIALVDTATTTKVAGFSGVVHYAPLSGSIGEVEVTSIPTISTNQLVVVANGYGAAATATITTNSISALVFSNNGVNYVNPMIEIIGDGVGAIVLPVMTNDTITGATIVDGGSGYTTATVVIRERYGAGASLIPLFKDQTGLAGSITTFSILERGKYESLPQCHNVEFEPTIGSGNSAFIDLNFRAASAKIEANGQFYSSVATGVSGNGSGGILTAYQTGGVITDVYVVNGGKNYYHGTTVTIPGGTVQCVLSPLITNGIISSVTVTSGGSGYTPPELDGITITSGVPITLNTPISGTGKIIGYNLSNGGSGYMSPGELTPLSISVSGGSGVKLLPLIANGSIIKVYVLDGGSGYQITDVITVLGGGGTSAELSPLVFNGRIVDIIIKDGGRGYQYGTSVIVVGDGAGGEITPVVETGITDVEIINGGELYAATTTIDITDDAGSGAVIEPIIVDGVITGATIKNKGSGYINPTVTLGTPGPGINAEITASSRRYISYLTITNTGSGYTYADIFILGDGEDADGQLVVEKLGSIESVGISNAGTGYTSTPLVTITDYSGYGAVSKIKITSGGDGYQKLPIVYLPTKYDEIGNVIADGVKLTCYGNRIGGVRRVSFDNHGAEYVDLPKSVFPYRALLKENSYFRPGEEVRIQSGLYKDENFSIAVLLESGDRVLLETGDPLGLDVDDTFYDVGVTATVKSVDYERNLVELDNDSDTFSLISELYEQIMTEAGIELVDQISGSIDEGEVIIGQQSRARATIDKVSVAAGYPTVGGSGWNAYSYKNNVGMCNHPFSVIADNHRFQDRAYVIKCGRALKDYVKLLKDTVHPAGYLVFCDVKTQTLSELSILNEIGYNAISIILLIYSVISPEFTSEWSEMDDLFGEFTKFNFEHLQIDLIDDYSIRSTTRYVMDNITEYKNTPKNFAKMNYWSMVNGSSFSTSTNIGPNGWDYAQQLSDLSSSNASYAEMNVSSNIGEYYTFEVFVRKQINPNTWPMLQFNGKTLKLHTETGVPIADSGMVYEIHDMGDYWWIRLSSQATTSTINARIYPAAGLTNNFASMVPSITGNIKIADAYVRHLTGVTPYTRKLRCFNSQYVPTMFRILNTETAITKTQ